jgi:hypothetical protein
LDFPALTILFTGLMAVATFWLALEAKKSRESSAKRAEELAFRSALLETAENLRSLRVWDPRLGGSPPTGWTSEQLEFVQLRQLMASTWLHPQLWARFMAVIAYLREEDLRLRQAAGAGNRQDVDRFDPLLDLYLQQLARSIVWEMRHHGLKYREAEGILGVTPFNILAWSFGDVETQQLGHYPVPSEPTDPDFAPARLSTLIVNAREAAEQGMASLRAQTKA